MIQRVQTVWMLLAAIAVFLTIQFSFYSGTLSLDTTYHVLTASDNFLLLVLTSALGTGILIAIFLYKHRGIQMRIIIVAIVTECFIVYLYIRQTTRYSQGNYSFWAALHILIVIFLVLAARGINRDARLIRQSNRLR